MKVKTIHQISHSRRLKFEIFRDRPQVLFFNCFTAYEPCSKRQSELSVFMFIDQQGFRTLLRKRFIAKRTILRNCFMFPIEVFEY